MVSWLLHRSGEGGVGGGGWGGVGWGGGGSEINEAVSSEIKHL